MKKLFLIAVALASSAYSQTSLNLNQVHCPPSSATSINVILAVPATVTTTISGVTSTAQVSAMSCIALDVAGFRLDTSVTPPVLRAVPPVIPAPPAFAYYQTVTGTLDGVNTVFTLPASPNPAISLGLFRNGLLLRAGVDYNLQGSTVTFMTGAIPQPGDALFANYRIS